MSRNQKEKATGTVCFMLVMATAIVLRNGWAISEAWYKLLLLLLPLLFLVAIVSRRRSG